MHFLKGMSKRIEFVSLNMAVSDVTQVKKILFIAQELDFSFLQQRDAIYCSLG